jgi:hypothetical protein
VRQISGDGGSRGAHKRADRDDYTHTDCPPQFVHIAPASSRATERYKRTDALQTSAATDLDR